MKIMRLPVKSTSAARSARKLASVTFGPRCSEPLSRSELLCLLRSESRAASKETTLSNSPSKGENSQPREINLIVLHCTDTKPSQDFTIEKLKASHKREGFGEYPGYHLYIRRDGTLYYCRPLSVRGCHVRGYNEHSIGVCYEGGHRENEIVLSGWKKEKGEGKNLPASKYEDNRTPAQKEVLREVLGALHEMYPGARICGHRDLNPHKACPCYDVASECANY